MNETEKTAFEWKFCRRHWITECSPVSGGLWVLLVVDPVGTLLAGPTVYLLSGAVPD